MEGGIKHVRGVCFPLKEVKLLKKVKRLLYKAKMPRYLHSMGPKTYEFADHLLALLIRESCKLAYRKTSILLSSLGVKCPTYSALAKMLPKIPPKLWNALLNATIGFKTTNVAALDGTYYSRSSPSFHYLARCKRKMPLKKAVQVVALIDTRRKKWLNLKTRLVRRHESNDFEQVVGKSCVIPKTLVADKASDWESVHKFCSAKGIAPHIPKRKNVFRGVQRNKHLQFFRTRTYHRRVIIESGFSRNKRAFGGFVKNHCCKTIKAEIFLRYICDNLALLKALIQEIFNRALKK